MFDNQYQACADNDCLKCKSVGGARQARDLLF